VTGCAIGLIDGFTLGEQILHRKFLLGCGSLLNLAGDSAHFGRDLFEIYTALMLRGISWMFDTGCAGYAPGLQAFPLELEREIAALTVRARADTSCSFPATRNTVPKRHCRNSGRSSDRKSVV
jgi:hypothetical protein